MRQKEFFGRGGISSVHDILKNESARNIFLVTGRNSYELSGAKNRLEQLLTGYKVDSFNEFLPNPQLVSVENGYKKFRRDHYDIIIAVGGGSVIDVAKAIRTFYFNDYKRKVPMVAIPTTAGSGSEATHFIVFYTDKKKQSEGDREVSFPEYSICDPDLIINLPRSVAASSGMDALSQAIESYWSVNSTEKSKQFAREAINLLMKNLEDSTNNNDRDSREKVMNAANLSGKAIEITRTTACHSISYPITSYFNVPHGHAVSLTLGEMLVYNFESEQPCIDPRGEDYLRSTLNDLAIVLGARNVFEARAILYDLMRNIGLETRLKGLRIDEECREIILKEGFNPERVKNNPRLLDENGLRLVLQNIS